MSCHSFSRAWWKIQLLALQSPTLRFAWGVSLSVLLLPRHSCRFTPRSPDPLPNASPDPHEIGSRVVQERHGGSLVRWQCRIPAGVHHCLVSVFSVYCRIIWPDAGSKSVLSCSNILLILRSFGVSVQNIGSPALRGGKHTRGFYAWYSWTRVPTRLHHTSCRQPCGLKALGLQRGIPYEISRDQRS
jgi:hypothetical protein